MKDKWTNVQEKSRTYHCGDIQVKINNPAAVFISKSRTHYISNADDTSRVIVPWPFNAIEIDVEDPSDWVYPEPRKDV